jgi:hypothetical protein
MSVITIEGLRKRFEVRDFPEEGGSCIVIPSGEFKPEWDKELLDQGYECYGHGKWVLVHLKRFTGKPKSVEERYMEKIVPLSVQSRQSRQGTPSKQKGRTPVRAPSWTKEENDYLIELWNQDPPLTKVQISKRFQKRYPARTGTSVQQRLDRLLKRKIITRRGQGQSPPVKSTPVRIPAPSKSAGPEIENEVSAIQTYLETIGPVVDKLGCYLLMQGLQVREQKGELTIPPALKVHYANALLEDDKRFRDVFRRKAEQLLEVIK